MRSTLKVAALFVLLVAAGCADEERAPVRGSPGVGAASRDQSLSSSEPSPVRFYREYVTVEPTPGTTRVSALYYFRNESDRSVEQVIRYPFPVDRNHLYPNVVRVWEQTDGALRPMGFAHRDASVIWRMELNPRGEKLIRVDYSQDTKSRHAIYIVTTTKEWKRPIELAEFEFRIPAKLGGVELSFVPDRRETRGDTTVYLMSRTDFMPEEDLVVTWESP